MIKAISKLITLTKRIYSRKILLLVQDGFITILVDLTVLIKDLSPLRSYTVEIALFQRLVSDCRKNVRLERDTTSSLCIHLCDLFFC